MVSTLILIPRDEMKNMYPSSSTRKWFACWHDLHYNLKFSCHQRWECEWMYCVYITANIWQVNITYMYCLIQHRKQGNPRAGRVSNSQEFLFLCLFNFLGVWVSLGSFFPSFSDGWLRSRNHTHLHIIMSRAKKQELETWPLCLPQEVKHIHTHPPAQR